MSAGILRVFLIFSSFVSFLGLVVGFIAGYQFFNAPLPDVPRWSPILGGLLGLMVASVIMGPNLLLAGIYENTLATAKALKKLSGNNLGSSGVIENESDDALREHLPLHAGHYLFMALIVAFFLFMGYAYLQRGMPKTEQPPEQPSELDQQLWKQP